MKSQENLKNGDRQTTGALEKDRESNFLELFNNNHRNVLITAYRIVGDHHIAEEIAQEVFLTAYKCLRKGMVIEKIPAWLKRTTINAALNVKRNKNIRKTFLLDDGIVKTSQNNPRMSAEINEMLEVITKTVENLPGKQKVAFTLRFLEAEKFNDIAEVLGCSVKSAMKNAERARNKVRKAIEALK